jgi:ribosomal protein S18 acetylase RimI-like enzyme
MDNAMTQLRPMRPSVFPTFLKAAVSSYAHDNVASGRWIAGEAVELARAETQKILPQGPNTPDHQLFEVHDAGDDEPVGFLWLASMRRGTSLVAYIYQLIVLPQYRRRGHAKAALRQAAAIVASQGHVRIELHVFGYNHAAIALYKSIGYDVSSLNMTMPLLPTLVRGSPPANG